MTIQLTDIASLRPRRIAVEEVGRKLSLADASGVPSAEELDEAGRELEQKLRDFKFLPDEPSQLATAAEVGLRRSSVGSAEAFQIVAQLAGEGLRAGARTVGMTPDDLAPIVALEAFSGRATGEIRREKIHIEELAQDTSGSALEAFVETGVALPGDLARILTVGAAAGVSRVPQVAIGLSFGFDAFLRDLPNGLPAAAEAFSKGFIMGQSLQMTGRLPVAAQPPAGAAIFGGATALEGATPEQVVGAAGVGAFLPAVLGEKVPKRRAVKEIQTEQVEPEGVSALKSARSKVGTRHAVSEGQARPTRSFRQAVTDDLDGILRMERDLTGEQQPLGPYEIARLTRGKNAMIEGSLTLGAPKVRPDGSHGFDGPGLQEILAPVARDLEPFLLYAAGRRAKRLKREGREILFTDAEIEAMIGLETTAFRQTLEKYQEFNQAILDFAQVKGIVRPEFRERFDPQTYIPFYRESNRKPSAKGKPEGNFRGIRRLTGGSSNVRDLLTNMIDNAAMLIDAGLTNEARVAVVDLAKRQKGGDSFLKPLAKSSKEVAIFKSDVRRELVDRAHKQGIEGSEVEANIDALLEGPGQLINFWQRGLVPRGPNVMAILRNGKPEYYEVFDPLLFRSVQSFNRPVQTPIVRLLSVPRRIGQSSITLSLDFMAANFVRDTLMGSVMSKHGFKPILDSARGLKSRLSKDNNYRDFVANGGGFASYLRDESSFRASLDRFYQSKDIDAQFVMDTPGRFLRGAEAMADAFEMSTRLGEFKKARAAGEHPRQAALAGREVSTDFAMRGDSQALGVLYDSVMFFKAGVNGVDRIYRGFVRDKNRAEIAAKTGILALGGIALQSINRGNPLYDQMEDWDKDTHWHFFIPTVEAMKADANGDDLPPLEERYTHFRYPRIWEIGAIARLGELSLELSLKRQFGEASGDAWRVVREMFRFDVVPQALRPAFDVARNRISFIDRPIETQSMQALEPFARARPTGSRALRALGEATRGLPREIQVPPAKVEALLRGYFNTWAVYGLTLSDAVFFDDVPDLRTDQYPVVRRFIAQEPRRQTRHLTELFDTIRAATETRRTLRAMDRSFRSDVVRDLAEKRENLLADQMTRVQRSLQGIRKTMNAVLNAPGLEETRKVARIIEGSLGPGDLRKKLREQGQWKETGKLKRGLMDRLITARNDFAKRVMDTVEK